MAKQALEMLAVVCLATLSVFSDGFSPFDVRRRRMSVTGLSSSSSSKAFFPNLHRSIPLRSSSHDYNSYEEEENETVSRKRRPVRSRTTRLIRRKSTTEKITSRTAETRRRHEQALKDPTLLTEVKFSDRSDIHPATKRAIVEILGLRSMTEIQAKTYDQVLAGRDVLGRAHTGTGKTLAYLLPSLERLLSSSLDEYRPGRDVGVLIIAPTRELVIQIAEQAQCVLSFHTDIHMEACDMYGGTSMHRDIRRLSGKSLPALIVATPGRLMDHLEQTRIRSRKFSDIMGETKIIVLDEVDQLVEGFSKELNRVFSYLPRAEKRQTLLFSATMPRKVRSYMNNQLKITNATEVDCVDRSEVIKSMVNTRIQQSYIILESMECYISTLVAIVMDAMKSENNKVLVFFPASNLVRFFARFFNEGLGIAVLELHSRMSQSSRSRASNNFRESSQSIMFTSDVSARGVDYPDVTLVVQYGAPSTNDNYIHRIGRTGRAGNSGEGLLVLLPFERSLVNRVIKLGLQLSERFSKLSEESTEEIEIQSLLDPVRQRVKSQQKLLAPSAEGAYRSFLAYYSANSNGRSPSEIATFAAVFANDAGLVDLPPVDSKLANRLGLDGLIDTI